MSPRYFRYQPPRGRPIEGVLVNEVVHRRREIETLLQEPSSSASNRISRDAPRYEHPQTRFQKWWFNVKRANVRDILDIRDKGFFAWLHNITPLKIVIALAIAGIMFEAITGGVTLGILFIEWLFGFQASHIWLVQPIAAISVFITMWANRD